MTYWWNSIEFSMTTVIFHFPFSNSMTFQDAWEDGNPVAYFFDKSEIV